MPPSERHLSPEEQAVVLALLAQDFPGVDELRAQVASAVVTSSCGCGCATVNLRTEDEPLTSDAPTRDRVLISAYVRGRDDGVLLFVKGERLSCLEVYSSDDEPAPLPRPEDLIIDPPNTWD